MAEQELQRVTRIKVTKLFGRYDHEIDLGNPDRVTILHGPNGVGKTTLLRMVAAAFSESPGQLGAIPFDTFEVSLGDGGGVEFRKAAGDSAVRVRPMGRPGQEIVLDTEPIGALAEKWAAIRARTIAETFGKYLSAPASVPNWVAESRRRVSVHFIEAQRLMRLKEPAEPWSGKPSDSYVKTVGTYADEFKERVSFAIRKYARKSQALDQSFPQRILEQRTPALPTEELSRRMRKLEAQRSKLRSIGLIDEGAAFDLSSLERLDDTRKAVMSLYVDDTEKKLATLDDLARRIEILLSHINRKFQDKTIRIDREKGLIAETAEGTELDLEALSSGEQHEIVLWYDLLFKVQPNTLVLIDEPELSLHVTWQKSFLPDLIEVVKTAGFDAVLATHSPFIVGDRHDLLVPLSAQAHVAQEELATVS